MSDIPARSASSGRLLFVVPNITSYGAFLTEVAHAAARAGFDTHCICDTRELWAAPHANVVEHTVFHAVAMPRGGDLRAHWAAARHIGRVIGDVRPALVHAHFSAAIFTTALARRRWWPTTIGTFHGLTFPVVSGLKHPLMRLAEVWSASRLTHAWVLTDDDHRALAGTLGPSHVTRQSGFGFGCDLRRFDPARFPRAVRTALRARVGLREDDFVVTFIGRFTDFKGFGTVVRGFLAAAPSMPRVRLLLVGSKDALHPTGLTDAECTALRRSDRVIDVGWQVETETYLAMTDIIALPSQREGMPVCLMEALAMGVPAITTATRGCREVVRHGVDGFVLPDRDHLRIASAIGDLASNPTVHREFRRNALAGRSRFDRQVFVAEQLGVYHTLIEQRHRRPDRMAS